MGRADCVLKLYGVSNFLADIDQRREYWRCGHLIGDLLDRLATEGFGDFFERFQDFSYTTAEEYRQRYAVAALRGLIGTMR